jgi:hypothetical protein
MLGEKLACLSLNEELLSFEVVSSLTVASSAWFDLSMVCSSTEKS